MNKLIMNKSIALGFLLASTRLMAQEMDMSSGHTGHMHHAPKAPTAKAPVPKATPKQTKPNAAPKNQPKKTVAQKAIPPKPTPKKVATQQKAPSTTDMSHMNHGSMDTPKTDHGSVLKQPPTSVTPAVSTSTEMDHSSMNHEAMHMPPAASAKDMPKKTDHGHMNHGMSNMQHDGMNHADMQMSGGDMAGMDHGTMNMGKMQGGKAPAGARSPDYSQGRDYGPIAPPHMMGNGVMAGVLFDQFEIARIHDQTTGRYAVKGWVGNDWNRVVVKAEGDIANSKLEESSTELLWRRPLSAFWNTELGIRHDNGEEKNQTWLALGINGVSPYWVELGATFYVGQDNQTALKTEATYDWRILQRLILQPSVEASLYGKTDTERHIGSGLSDITTGLRLRYEVNRQFAPYIGVETARQFGKTADLVKASGEKVQDTYAVAGLRFWF